MLFISSSNRVPLRHFIVTHSVLQSSEFRPRLERASGSGVLSRPRITLKFDHCVAQRNPSKRFFDKEFSQKLPADRGITGPSHTAPPQHSSPEPGRFTMPNMECLCRAPTVRRNCDHAPIRLWQATTCFHAEQNRYQTVKALLQQKNAKMLIFCLSCA